MFEKWDVHTHTTLSPSSYTALERFSHYADFIRVRAHQTQPCTAELVNSRNEVQRTIEDNAYVAASRLSDCDRHRVTMQVLSPTPMMVPDYVDKAEDAAEICKILNDNNAELVAEHPTRFVALAALPMLAVDKALAEMERIAALGMRGLSINSNIAGCDLDDARFYPIFAAAAEMNLAIFIHPWGGFMEPTEARLKRRMHTQYNWRPWLLAMGMETALAFDALRTGKVHERLPQLRVLYAHGGGVFPSLLGRMDHGAYCRPDLFPQPAGKTPYEVVHECSIYADTLTHNPWALEFLLQTLGVKRVAMGSDYPYPLGELDVRGERGLYPGYMVEHLPTTPAGMEVAWERFPWLSRHNGDGPRALPCLSLAEKQRLLAGTAKEWLQWKS